MLEPHQNHAALVHLEQEQAGGEQARGGAEEADHVDLAGLVRIESIYARICATGLDAECQLLGGSEAGGRRMASINYLLTCHSEQYALMFGSDIEQRAKLPKEYL